jgi:hypothetical protein
MAAVEEIGRHGWGLAARRFDAGDGTRFQPVREGEGNTLALASWEPPKEPRSWEIVGLAARAVDSPSMANLPA